MSSRIQIPNSQPFSGFLKPFHLTRRVPLPLSDCSQRSWFTILAFYGLVFYDALSETVLVSAYIPTILIRSLDILPDYPALPWLNDRFLPQSPGFSLEPVISISCIGAALTWIGLLLFSVGAAQFYVKKWCDGEAVIRGVYRFIRHPQYTGLAVSGLGLLLLFPRNIELVTFIAMLFGFYCLGRIEEHACKEKFGQVYIDYKRRTGMFLPIHLPYVNRLPRLPRSGLPRFMAIMTLYLLVTIAAIAFTNLIKDQALHTLTIDKTPNSPFCSSSRTLINDFNDVASKATDNLGVPAYW